MKSGYISCTFESAGSITAPEPLATHSPFDTVNPDLQAEHEKPSEYVLQLSTSIIQLPRYKCVPFGHYAHFFEPATSFVQHCSKDWSIKQQNVKIKSLCFYIYWNLLNNLL